MFVESNAKPKSVCTSLHWSECSYLLQHLAVLFSFSPVNTGCGFPIQELPRSLLELKFRKTDYFFKRWNVSIKQGKCFVLATHSRTHISVRWCGVERFPMAAWKSGYFGILSICGEICLYSRNSDDLIYWFILTSVNESLSYYRAMSDRNSYCRLPKKKHHWKFKCQNGRVTAL